MWIKRRGGGAGERVDHRRKHIAKGTRQMCRPLCHSLPLAAVCHFTAGGSVPPRPRVGSMKACFLPFSTKALFAASCFCSDKRVSGLPGADRPAESCCGLFVQRGHIITGTENLQMNWHQLSRMSKYSFNEGQQKRSISLVSATELWTQTQSR